MIEKAVARRAVVLWLLVRGMIGVLLLIFDENPAFLHPRATVVVVAVVGFLSWLDTKSQNEHVLLANLGTERWAIHLLGVGPPFLLEVGVAVVARL